MSIETLQLISLILFILAGVMLALSIVIFFVLKIPTVIGDVSGATARKAIKNIRAQNIESGDKAYKPSVVNQNRGKVTDKISSSGKLVRNDSVLGVAVGTEELSQKANPMQGPVSMETTILETAEETTILPNNGNPSLPVPPVNQNMQPYPVPAWGQQPYQPVSQETTVLTPEQLGMAPPAPAPVAYSAPVIPDNVIVEYEIGFTGSNEIIE